MKLILILSIICSITSSCSNKSPENQTIAESQKEKQATPSLTQVWATDSIMTTTESVIFDPATDIIFVSNINGFPSKRNGSGFITKLKRDGTVIQHKWITGLNTPAGMALMNGKLFVNDVDQLLEIDIAQGKIASRYPVKNAGFLNDAATDGNKIYVTDSEKGHVHVFEKGKFTTLAEGLDGINGIELNDQGEVLILDGKGLRKLNQKDKSIELVNEVVTGGDGVVIINDSTYLSSRWQGEVYLIRNGKEHLLLDTKEEKINSADIGFIQEENLVLVPTFFDNRIVAYKLEY
jgi:DNA gyrase/topoisomerase IV subunit A